MNRYLVFVAGAFFASIIIIGGATALRPPLKCAMRTADGCVMWFDPAGIDRFKNGEAGSAGYSNLLTGKPV